MGAAILNFNKIARWMFDTSGNVTGLVGPGGTQYAALPLDVNGNVIASVGLRSDTLANLLLVADAANGEVAVATDVPAMVRYFGSPSVGQVFGMSAEVGEMNVSGSLTTVPTATDTKVLFNGGNKKSTDAYIKSLWENANNYFVAPPLAYATHLSFDIVSQAAAAGGSYRKIAVEYDDSDAGDRSSWSVFGVSSVVASSASLNPTNCLSITAPNIMPGRAHRVVCMHDTGSNLYYVTHTISIKLLRLS